MVGSSSCFSYPGSEDFYNSMYSQTIPRRHFQHDTAFNIFGVPRPSLIRPVNGNQSPYNRKTALWWWERREPDPLVRRKRTRCVEGTTDSGRFVNLLVNCFLHESLHHRLRWIRGQFSNFLIFTFCIFCIYIYIQYLYLPVDICKFWHRCILLIPLS